MIYCRVSLVRESRSDHYFTYIRHTPHSSSLYFRSTSTHFRRGRTCSLSPLLHCPSWLLGVELKRRGASTPEASRHVLFVRSSSDDPAPEEEAARQILFIRSFAETCPRKRNVSLIACCILFLSPMLIRFRFRRHVFSIFRGRVETCAAPRLDEEMEATDTRHIEEIYRSSRRIDATNSELPPKVLNSF